MRLGKLKVILEIIPFVPSLLNCSEESLVSQMHLWATSLAPKEREGSGLCVPQPLPLGQLGFDLFYILKFLIQLHLEEGFHTFLF